MSGTPVRPASTQEKIHRQKTKEGDTQAGYLQEKLVGSEYVTIVEEDGSVGKRLKVEVDASALGTAIDSGKVLVSSTDTTKDYLYNKLVAGNAIAITKTTGGDESVTIAGAYAAGAGISITNDTIASTITQVVTEYPFTGSTLKVPYSAAIKKLLQALYITNATDCGSTGSALLETVKDIPLGSCSFVENTIDPTFDEAAYPNLNQVMNSPVLWQTSRNYGRKPLNSLDVYSMNELANKEYVAVIANFSIDEDVNLIKDSIINIDVMFYCPPISNSSAFVQCQAVLWSETDPATQYRPSSSIKEVVYDAVNTVVRRAKFEIYLSSGSPTAPLGKWLYGALIFTCKADAVVKGALINGIRVRYRRDTIGLRVADTAYL